LRSNATGFRFLSRTACLAGNIFSFAGLPWKFSEFFDAIRLKPGRDLVITSTLALENCVTLVQLFGKFSMAMLTLSRKLSESFWSSEKNCIM
jgi:hypothetical protein